MALRKIGLKQTHAYHAIKPDITSESAKVGAVAWNRRLAPAVAMLEVSDAMAALADWRVTMAMVQAPTTDALRAADMAYKRLGLYQDTAVQVAILGSAAGSLEPAGSAPETLEMPAISSEPTNIEAPAPAPDEAPPT